MSIYDKPHDRANELVYGLLDKVGYERSWNDMNVYEKPDGSLYITLSNLPVLPFFVFLAETLGVGIDTITVKSAYDSGCQTCGGGSMEFTVAFPRGKLDS